jgi:radical SAM superfamily enzyme YgiQ (UPF0313 family)
MRVLLTTPTYEGVIPFFTCRQKYDTKLDDIHDRDDLLQLCMNSEYQMGWEWPNGALAIIKENVPSIDTLDYPSFEEYERSLDENKYDAVAFSFYRRDMPRIIKMAEMARRYGVKELWAGNYGANSPGTDRIFDRIIPGEGVEPMKSLVEGKTFEKLRHPVVIGRIFYRFPVGYLYTAIGCRYKCKFCSTKNFIPEPKYFPIEEVCRVLDIYVREGIRTVTILDETFLQDRKRADEVIRALHERGLMWHCTTRINLLMGRIKELYDMGMRSVYTGIESLSDKTLKVYTKGHSLSKVYDVFKELNDMNIRTTVSYILGYEFDTVDSLLESFDLLKNVIRPFCNPFLVLTPHMNSKIAHLEPLIDDHKHDHYDTRHLVWKHPHLAPEDIRELLWLAHKETVHPKNHMNKKIVKKLSDLESAGPLFSHRVYSRYRQRQEIKN